MDQEEWNHIPLEFRLATAQVVGDLRRARDRYFWWICLQRAGTIVSEELHRANEQVQGTGANPERVSREVMRRIFRRFCDEPESVS